MQITFHAVVGPLQRVDELCPNCWLPAMVEVTTWVMDDKGVYSHTWRACAECEPTP